MAVGYLAGVFEDLGRNTACVASRAVILRCALPVCFACTPWLTPAKHPHFAILSCAGLPLARERKLPTST